MAIEFSNSAPSQEQEQEQPTQQDELKKQVQMGMNGNGNGNGQEGMGMDGQGQGQGELELHRACAGGNLDEVRGVLSRGLEQLEILDMNTGCTPIVLAIRGNFPEVVRELLSAGAIVPPPGITNDPAMLSLLYPQPMFSHGPPQFMHPQHMIPEFYPQQAFYDPRQQAQQANLPPAEVAKTIPCRNFPNCKYGSACVFLHPRAPFYPPGPGGPGFGYDGYQSFQPMPYFNPQANGFQPQQLEGEPQFQQPQPQSQPQSDMPQENDAQNQPQFNDQHSLSGAPAPFVPFGMTSPPPAQFGLSPMSPQMMPPMSPHDAAQFFAQSPPNGMMPPPNGAPFNPRRLSVNGFQKPFNGKKPSFSGGPRPWAGTRAPGVGGWKDGTPPPCAFFAQSKCRNGEFCKFPHLDAEGNDMRHPDVVRGVMAPAKVQKPIRQSMGGFGFDPSRQFVPRSMNEEPQSQAQAQAQSLSTPVEAIPETDSAPVTDSSAPASAEVTVTEAQQSTDQVEAPKTAQPIQVNGNGITNGNGNAAISRSASQPGVQRFQHQQQQNGFHSRAQSPAFQGNGNGPRRAGRPFPANGNVVAQQGVRSVSAGGGGNKQRIPNADEFPALGGMSGNTSPQEKSVSAFSKTAAQVLSAPAPPKPEVVKDSSEDEVTMDDESDSDAVIITMNKASEKSIPAPAQETSAAVEEKKEVTPSAPAPAVSKPSTISFASVASAIKEISTGSIESTPVALKA